MTAKPSERPVEIHERKPITLPLALLFSLLGATVAATLGYAAISSKLDSSVANLADTRALVEKNESRIRALEQERVDFATLKNDVAWIKRAMEEDRRRSLTQAP